MIFIRRDKSIMRMNSLIGSSEEGKSIIFFYAACIKEARHLLADIKRKTTEGQETSTDLVPVTRGLDLEKFMKEAGLFSNEMKQLKTRQTEVEKMSKMIFAQNTKLLKENKLLWSELMKSKYIYKL